MKTDTAATPDDAVALRKWAVDRALSMCPAHLSGGGTTAKKIIETATALVGYVRDGKADNA
ncbi:hypothetical protein [Thalassobaculum sp.]|uniref:hypothetical protein n=1 Tax=Thalassobaculum sp. TaxID=2022740 RepID=UPI0032EFA550